MQISNCLAVDVNIINICANNVYSVNFACNGIQYAVVTSVRGHVNAGFYICVWPRLSASFSHWLFISIDFSNLAKA